ncbi:hypothetical protein GOODEAATRI_006582 [Goodea atripinnis]|uniref:Glutathione peroxidase n=1 Tax=Goodea atripinnis TaxID=208336 RepID=A0ABV0PBW9_9TELE
MHAGYAERGLRILAFPSNQFGNQEPGNETQIKQFVQSYDVHFDMFSKIEVNATRHSTSLRDFTVLVWVSLSEDLRAFSFLLEAEWKQQPRERSGCRRPGKGAHYPGPQHLMMGKRLWELATGWTPLKWVF